MPSHLNPKSRLTSSLFATTLFASFFVVALPHILPCPASKPVAFNDDNTIRRLSNQKTRENFDENKNEKYPTIKAEVVDLQLKNLEKRQCPLPKPRGLLQTFFGFKSDNDGNSNGGENGIKPP